MNNSTSIVARLKRDIEVAKSKREWSRVFALRNELISIIDEAFPGHRRNKPSTQPLEEPGIETDGFLIDGLRGGKSKR